MNEFFLVRQAIRSNICELANLAIGTINTQQLRELYEKKEQLESTLKDVKRSQTEVLFKSLSKH